MAVLPLRRLSAEAYAGPGVRRGRKERRRVRVEAGTGVVLPGALGARRPRVLHGYIVSRALQERSVHRLPRLVEQGSRAATGLQRRVRPLREWKAGQSIKVRGLRRRF